MISHSNDLIIFIINRIFAIKRWWINVNEYHWVTSACQRSFSSYRNAIISQLQPYSLLDLHSNFWSHLSLPLTWSLSPLILHFISLFWRLSPLVRLSLIHNLTFILQGLGSVALLIFCTFWIHCKFVILCFLNCFLLVVVEGLQSSFSAVSFQRQIAHGLQWLAYFPLFPAPLEPLRIQPHTSHKSACKQLSFLHSFLYFYRSLSPLMPATYWLFQEPP